MKFKIAYKVDDKRNITLYILNDNKVVDEIYIDKLMFENIISIISLYEYNNNITFDEKNIDEVVNELNCY